MRLKATCICIYIELVMMTSTDVVELVTKFWRQNVDHHRRHGGQSPDPPGHHSLCIEAGGQGPETSHHGWLAHHVFVPLLTLGQLTTGHVLSLEAEVARDCTRHIRQMLITRNSTGGQWFMLLLWQQSCVNDECSWS